VGKTPPDTVQWLAESRRIRRKREKDGLSAEAAADRPVQSKGSE